MAVKREQLIRTAEKYVSRGKIDAAIREYRKVLEDNPNDTNTLNRVGDLYARIRRIEDAVRLFTQIAEQYSNEGFFVKAIAIYKKILKLDPTRLEVYERLAELYHREGLINEARTQYQVLAEYYLKHANAASAIHIYQRMSELEPANPSYRAKLAELYRQERLLDKAVAEYLAIADLMLEHGHLDEAAEVCEKALDVDPHNVDFIREAVSKLRQAGAAQEADEFLARAAKRNPEAAAIAGMEGPAPVAEAEPEAADAEKATQPDDTSLSVVPELELGESLPDFFGPTDASAGEATDDGLGGLFELEEVDETGGALPQPETGEQPEAIQASPEAEQRVPSEETEDDITVDLEDVFTLDLESEEQPSSQVTPPPDMLQRDESGELPPGLALRREGGQEAMQEEPAAAPAAGRELGIDPELLEQTAAEVQPEASVREEDLLTEAEVLAKYGLQQKALERLGDLLQRNPECLGAYRLMIQLRIDERNHTEVRRLAAQMADLASQTNQWEDWEALRARLLEVGYGVEGDRVVSDPEAPTPKEDRIDRLLKGLVEEEEVGELAPQPPGGVQALEMEEAPAPEAEEAEVPEELPEPTPQEVEEVAQESVSTHPQGGADQLLDLEIDTELPELSFAEGGPGPEEKPAAEEAPAAAEPAEVEESAAEPELASVAGDSILDDSGVNWLDEVSAVPKDSGDVESLFDGEEDFFDLASELEQELGEEVRAEAARPTEHSLEEIVDRFKKGVSEKVSDEDYDTHFNLGIAYREMDLLDEAIGEFQMAAKDPRYLVDCCSMLGMCFMEKGLPELAVKWYQRGLESGQVSEEEGLALLYEMGNAYLLIGDRDAARKTFVEIYGTNTNYRDVVAKLEELGHPH